MLSLRLYLLRVRPQETSAERLAFHFFKNSQKFSNSFLFFHVLQLVQQSCLQQSRRLKNNQKFHSFASSFLFETLIYNSAEKVATGDQMNSQSRIFFHIFASSQKQYSSPLNNQSRAFSALLASQCWAAYTETFYWSPVDLSIRQSSSSKSSITIRNWHSLI